MSLSLPPRRSTPWSCTLDITTFRRLKSAAAVCLCFTALVCLAFIDSSGDPLTNARITWRDEFDSSLELSTVDEPKRWRIRGVDDGGPLTQGYKDYAGASWNVSPFQHRSHSPFTVENGILTITARRNPGLADVEEPWIGGMLVSDPLAGHSFTYGYFEIRMRLPNPGRGMFPAIWLYSNAMGGSTASNRSAEIDIFEIFGNPSGRPWVSTVRRNPHPGIDQSVGEYDEATKDWHRYGLEWTPYDIRIYRDGILRGEISGDVAAWFQGVPMGIRLNYAMNPRWEGALNSTASDPSPDTGLRMEIDYVRRYDRKPTRIATGSADPEARFSLSPQPTSISP